MAGDKQININKNIQCDISFPHFLAFSGDDACLYRDTHHTIPHIVIHRNIRWFSSLLLFVSLVVPFILFAVCVSWMLPFLFCYFTWNGQKIAHTIVHTYIHIDTINCTDKMLWTHTWMCACFANIIILIEFFYSCKNEVIRLLILYMYQCKHCCYPEPMPPPSPPPILRLHFPHFFFTFFRSIWFAPNLHEPGTLPDGVFIHLFIHSHSIEYKNIRTAHTHMKCAWH